MEMQLWNRPTTAECPEGTRAASSGPQGGSLATDNGPKNAPTKATI